jgi:acyl-ACP thioesterase
LTGRRFRAEYAVRLSDTDVQGRLRLDAVARFLQDVASDDVDDAGFSADEHVWVVRRTSLTVEEPFAGDERVALETWCSGVAAAAAARRSSLQGDRGGRVEAESIWIHLDHELRPLRHDARFLAVYGPSAAGRGVSTRLTLPPSGDRAGGTWRFRGTDADRLGHVNNAAYWVVVEETGAGRLGGRLGAVLEYRRPIDPGEPVELVEDGPFIWLRSDGEDRAAARVDILRP